MEIREVIKKAEVLRPLTEIDERECLARLAMEVKPRSEGHNKRPTIVEIGCLYGGTTAVLALANPDADVICIDTFEWHPEDDVPTSEELLYSNMEKVGVKNVTVITGDSRVVWKTWREKIDLLFIDGGHSFEWVYSDLSHFAPFSQVIALHDYGNPFWRSIRQAVDQHLKENPNWRLAEVVGTVAVLRRR